MKKINWEKRKLLDFLILFLTLGEWTIFTKSGHQNFQQLGELDVECFSPIFNILAHQNNQNVSRVSAPHLKKKKKLYN